MRRREVWAIVVITWFLIAASGGSIWALLLTNQTGTSTLINTIDLKATARSEQDKADSMAALKDVAGQVKAGLDKSDGIAIQAAEIGSQAADIGRQTKELADQIKTLTEQGNELLKDLKTVLEQHTQDIKAAKRAATRAEVASVSGEVQTRKAVKVITQPKPSWWQKLTRPSPTPK